MKIRLISVALLFAFLGVWPATADDPKTADAFKISDKLVSAIEKRAKRIRAKRKVPSFVVGVVSKGRLVYAKGFGFRNLKAKRPAGVATLYHIGSISKPITATVLALLIKKGAIDLDDPIEKYLPDHVRLPTYKGREVKLTVRHLATHSSGLPRDPRNRKNVAYGLFPNPGQAEPYSRHELYKALGKTELQFAPGSRCSYSNFGFGLLGHVLERAGGKRLEALMKEQLFRPLGMTRTTVTLDEEALQGFATHYWQDDPQRLDRPRTKFGDILGHGGVVSSVKELARFVSFQFGRYDREKLGLPPEANRLLWQAQSSSDGKPLTLERDGVEMRMCLGWRVQEPGRHGGILTHSGEMDGHSAYLAFAPKVELGVIVLCNLGNSSLPFRKSSPAIELGVWMKKLVLYQALGWPADAGRPPGNLEK